MMEMIRDEKHDKNFVRQSMFETLRRGGGHWEICCRQLPPPPPEDKAGPGV